MPYIKIRGQKEIINITEQDYYQVEQAKQEAIDNVQLSIGGFAVGDIRGWVLKDIEEAPQTFNFKEKEDLWLRERVKFLVNSPQDKAKGMEPIYSTFCKITAGYAPSDVEIQAFQSRAETFYKENPNRHYPNWDIFSKDLQIMSVGISNWALAWLRALSYTISTDREFGKVIVKFFEPHPLDNDLEYQAFAKAIQPDSLTEIKAEDIFQDPGDNRLDM